MGLAVALERQEALRPERKLQDQGHTDYLQEFKMCPATSSPTGQQILSMFDRTSKINFAFYHRLEA